MELLLDTHAIIWMVSNPLLIPEKTLSLIESSNNKCYVSIASLWEIAIKYSMGRLELKGNIETSFKSIFKSGIELLPVSANHALIVGSLPFHHKDPFDRMIIAQSISEDFTIISKDAEFKNYDVKVIW